MSKRLHTIGQELAAQVRENDGIFALKPEALLQAKQALASIPTGPVLVHAVNSVVCVAAQVAALGAKDLAEQILAVTYLAIPRLKKHRSAATYREGQGELAKFRGDRPLPTLNPGPKRGTPASAFRTAVRA